MSFGFPSVPFPSGAPVPTPAGTVAELLASGRISPEAVLLVQSGIFSVGEEILAQDFWDTLSLRDKPNFLPGWTGPIPSPTLRVPAEASTGTGLPVVPTPLGSPIPFPLPPRMVPIQAAPARPVVVRKVSPAPPFGTFTPPPPPPPRFGTITPPPEVPMPAPDLSGFVIIGGRLKRRDQFGTVVGATEFGTGLPVVPTPLGSPIPGVPPRALIPPGAPAPGTPIPVGTGPGAPFIPAGTPFTQGVPVRTPKVANTQVSGGRKVGVLLDQIVAAGSKVVGAVGTVIEAAAPALAAGAVAQIPGFSPVAQQQFPTVLPPGFIPAPAGQQFGVGSAPMFQPGFGFTPAAGIPFVDIVPESQSPIAIGGPFFSATRAGARARSTVAVPNPITGQPTWFRHVGKPVLFAGDARLCRRIEKIGRKAARRPRRR